jgi:hypothetical protein
MLAGLVERYAADPLRPHSVYEAFLRSTRGYLALMIVVTTRRADDRLPGFTLWLYHELRGARKRAARSSLRARAQCAYPVDGRRDRRSELHGPMGRSVMTTTKSNIPKSVSRYMSRLAHLANQSMRGTPMAKERSRKAVEARREKMEERKAKAV